MVTALPPSITYYSGYDRAFPVAASRVWNSLPPHVTSAQSLPVFRSRLKTHLFRRSFPWLYCCAREVTLVIMDTLIAVFTYLLISWNVDYALLGKLKRHRTNGHDMERRLSQGTGQKWIERIGCPVCRSVKSLCTRDAEQPSSVTSIRFSSDMRAFSVAAPRAWNRLPTELKLLRSTDLFRRDLKTFLFHSVYEHQDMDWLYDAPSVF